MMSDLRNVSAPTKLLLFTSQVLVLLLTFDVSFADPPGILHHRRDERPIPKYKYSYMVHGLEGGQHGHQVYRDGAYTQGKYFVKLNGGSGQNVEYYTDHLGYHPKVVYMNQMGTGSSGARIAFGRAVPQYEIPKNYTPETSTTLANETSTSESHLNQTDTTTPYIVEAQSPSQSQQTANFTSPESEQSRVKPNDAADNEKFNSEATTSSTANEDNVSDNIYNSHSVGSIAPLLLTHPSEDPYLQPEINEITNGFVGKIVSMIPGLITSKTKLLKPIIVTDNAGANKRETNETNAKPDQAAESSQPEEYQEIPDEQELVIGKTPDSNLTTDDKPASKYTEVEYKKPQVDVEIEPQLLEEQAVITTTVDITKSLPLTVNFVPETDNQLTDLNQPLPLNLVPHHPEILPQPHLLLQPQHVPDHPIMELLPQGVLKPEISPQQLVLPNSEFHYIPIPVIQHQPNIIPLNFNNETIPEIRHLEQAPIFDAPKSDYTFVKSEDLSNPYKLPDLPKKPFRQQPFQIELRRPAPLPYNVPTAHLIPYVKHMQNIPPQMKPIPAAPKSHSITYNAKTFPKQEIRKPHQKTPFKPSHPLWDSVYPPSHMYYVPFYVIDKVPGERNPKDSFSRRHHHLRRLYVEYGGFKPPLIPSTLIETEESTNEKRDVPKDSNES